MRFFIRHYIFRWRRAMHEYYMSHWTKLRSIEGSSQRVQEDTMQFARAMEIQGVSFVSAAMTLIAFLPILYGYSVHITELPIVGKIPQALVWASIFWALIGTVFVYFIGIKLPGLEFKNQRVERHVAGQGRGLQGIALKPDTGGSHPLQLADARALDKGYGVQVVLNSKRCRDFF